VPPSPSDRKIKVFLLLFVHKKKCLLPFCLIIDKTTDMSKNNTLADYWRSTGMAGPVPEAAQFGDTPAQQDALCGLVRSGVKRGTASLARWHATPAEQPRAGDQKIILDGAGTPRGIIEITMVEEVAFSDVTSGFAAIEGEGDGSLAYWRAEHERFFTSEQAKEGLDFVDTELLILEHFKLIWPQP
jgi:uncharacterized protein YhfF